MGHARTARIAALIALETPETISLALQVRSCSLTTCARYRDNLRDREEQSTSAMQGMLCVRRMPSERGEKEREREREREREKEREREGK